jgi:hypothetical protein
MSSASSIGLGSNAIQNAQLGISRGMANLSRDAQAIVTERSARESPVRETERSARESPAGAQGSTGGSSDDTITAALVDARQQALNVEASARALSITDQTLGTLLDIKA